MERLTVIAALGGLMMMLPLTNSHAACEYGERISNTQARCMTSERWSSSGFFNNKRHVKVKNQCPEWGKVVAKVDIKGGTDATWTLTDGNWRYGSWRHPTKIRQVSCCKDLSDLCSKSDVLTPQGCETQFKKSSAARTCYDGSFEVNGESCVVNASCKRINQEFTKTSITAHYLRAKTVNNCNGTLTLDSC